MNKKPEQTTTLDQALVTVIDSAVEALREGALVAYPTEGVYGIGCDPLNPHALQQVIDIKQRDADKGLIVVAAEFEQLTELIAPLDAAMEKKLLATWPGPVTWIVEARDALPELLTGGRSTLAVRVSNHPVIVELSRKFGRPIVSTSANYSGQPAATSAGQVQSTLGAQINVIIDAPLGGQTGATPIFDAASGKQLR